MTLGKVYRHLDDTSIRWFYFSCISEVTDGPFPTRRAATKELVKHQSPDYGTVDDETLEDMRQELIRLLDASFMRPDNESMGQKNYRFGIATGYEAMTKILTNHPVPVDAEFHANEVRVKGD